MKRVLFVCSQNRLRSPTAEQVFADWPGVEVASAGLNHDAECPVTADLIAWSDLILVMEPSHRNKLSKRFRAHLHNKRVVTLSIPDRYDFMDPDLVKRLMATVPRWLPARSPTAEEAGPMTSPLRSYAVPLRTLDPTVADRSDLAAVGRAIGDARIVSIGESTHCNREFYLLKDRLFRYLASEHGFTGFVLESGFVEGLRLDEWLQGGVGDVRELARNAITYGLGDCNEMVALLEWMRDWNSRSDRKLHFYGMDLGGSTTSPGTSVAASLARIDTGPGDDWLAAQSELGPQHEALVRWIKMNAEERARLTTGVEALLSRAETSGNDIARLSAKSAQVICHAIGRMTSGALLDSYPLDNPRDAFMVETVRWILEREPRILIAAHNGHIQRTPLIGRPVLGSMLAQSDLPKPIVIGASSASGEVWNLATEGIRFTGVTVVEMNAPPDGIDAELARIGLPLCLVDLRQLPANMLTEPTTMMVQGAALPIMIREAFDLLIYVGRLTFAAGMLDHLREAIDRANRFMAE